MVMVSIDDGDVFVVVAAAAVVYISSTNLLALDASGRAHLMVFQQESLQYWHRRIDE
jgi:hypothetical protein